MSNGQYAVGAVLFALMLASLTVTALFIRRMLLPRWSQAPARLAEAVIGIAALVFAAELLGTIGEFRRWHLVVLCVVMAIVATLVFHLRTHDRDATMPAKTEDDALTPPNQGVVPTAAAIVVVAVALISWMHRTLDALHDGMREWDTLQYHMPFAARFVQDASVTGMQYVGNAPVSFYPMNSELVHATGILIFQADILSPVLNIAWLGLALLAAWCIGRPAGVAPATMAATALVASLPVMTSSQAGAAKNDIVALALLLAAVALLVNGRGSRAALILAALAAGLAAGTRLNLWAPAIVLGAVVVIAGWNGSRRAAAGWWLVGVIAGSGLWYARNLVETGNPLPWFGVKIAGLVTLHSTTAPADCGQASVADFATDPGFVRTHLLPQLPGALGTRWWLVLSLGAVGIGAGLLSRRTPMGRGLAAVALVSGVAYLLTPTTAGGVEARCFAFNTRFAVPALALGLIVLPLVLSRWRVHPLVGVLAFLLTVVVTGDLNRHTFFDARPMLATILLISVVTAAALLPWRALPRPALAGALVVLVAVGGALLWREQDSYLRARYTQPQLYQPVEGVYTVLRRVSHARVALRGFSEQYPLYGLDASNRVDLPAARVEARFAPYKTCPSWLLALSRGRYDYVVTARQGERESPAAEWTRRYPGAQEVLAAGPGSERKGNQWRWQLFRLVPGRPVDLQTACHSA